MKVIFNDCYGGFSFSKEEIALYNEKEEYDGKESVRCNPPNCYITN